VRRLHAAAQPVRAAVLDERGGRVRHLSEGEAIPTDAVLVDAAIALALRHRLALWDATILAAAQRRGLRRRHHQGVRIRDPFRTSST
jgi:predicted nucleic acid-binding protein